jgi:hypothetical protein
MIYTRFGNSVEVLADCGEHRPTGWKYAARILKVRWREEDDGEGYVFAPFLRADGGIKEIEKAIEAAPKVELTAAEAGYAINRAV